MPAYYEITISDELDSAWATWFRGMRFQVNAHGETVLSGMLDDQAALHGMLNRIRDLNLTLISVSSSPAERLHDDRRKS